MILDHDNLPTRVIPGEDFTVDRTGDWEQRPLDFVRKQKLGELGVRFKASVAEHGILTPLAVHLDTTDNTVTLLNGHHRYFLAEELAIEVPLVWSVFPGTWRELRASDEGHRFDAILDDSGNAAHPGAYR
jgi:hypothetical protein